MIILCVLSASPSSLLASDGLVRELAIIWTMVRRPVHSIRSTGPCPVRVLVNTGPLMVCSIGMYKEFHK